MILIPLLFLSACDLREYRTLEQEKTEKANIIKSKDTIDDSGKLPNLGSPKDTAVITHAALIKSSKGNFSIGLYGYDAPETVANFIGLAKLNFYNGVLFHRVAKNFMIQAGDRNTLFQEMKTEWGFGGKSFYGGDIEDELDPNTPSYKMGYVKGTVAMANKGPNTNTSQFFICLEEAFGMKRNWTIFGKVISGMNVVENISNVPVEPSERGDHDGIPVKPVRIYSINIKYIRINE